MAYIGFFGIFLTFMVLSAIFGGHKKNPEKLTNTVPAYEYAGPLDENAFTFTATPSTSLSEDNATFPAEREEIPSEMYEYNVTEEHIQFVPTEPMSTEMGNLYQPNDDYTFTTGEAELYTTPTMQVDVYTNDTSIALAENIPLSIAFTLIKFATVMLLMVGFAFFITTLYIMWFNNFIFPSIIYKVMFKYYHNNKMLGNGDTQFRRQKHTCAAKHYSAYPPSPLTYTSHN